ncbi:MAG: YihY/virulence factor BrkB family protein [Fodinibius sp.]|nr:YihY/virulence factor BrkB family protein [Fodinibius sp.]
MKLIRNSWILLKETYDGMWEINIGLHGAAIAFYAIFSTAPLVIIIVWITGLLLGSQLGQVEFQETLSSVVGPQLAPAISDLVQSTTQGSSGLWSSLIAGGTVLFGATTLLSQLKHTLNTIWGLTNPNVGTVWHFVWSRLVGLLFIGFLSLLFLTGLISESLLYGLENVLLPILGSKNLFFVQLGNSLINLLLAFVFITAMFRILPDLDVRWRDLAIGGLVTTLLVLAGKSVVDWYLSAAAFQTAYAAAGSFVVFLIWIYYNVQVLLIGAIFTKAYTSRFGAEVTPYWDATLEE